MKFKNVFNTYSEYENYKNSTEYKNIIVTDDIVSFCKDQHKTYYDHYINLPLYYVYWGPTLPTINTNPKSNLSQPVNDSGNIYYTPGWYSLGLSIDNYTQSNPFKSPEFSIGYDQNTEQCNYLLIPKNMIMTDGGDVPYIDNSGNPIDINNTAIKKYGEIEIQENEYNIYTNLINAQLSEGIQIKLYSI